MNPVHTALVVAAIAFAISAVATLMIDPPTGERVAKVKALGKAVLAGLVSALLGHLAATSVMSMQALNSVHGALERRTPYDDAAKFVDTLPNRETRALFTAGLQVLDHRLDLIQSGQLLIDRDDVFNTWENLFSGTQQEVLATNLVSEGDWEFFGPGGEGRRIQESATGRGVNVVRIMLYDPSLEGHRDGLRRVGCLHQDVGVKVRELPIDVLENPTYTGWLEKLRTPDMVLYDNEYLLLTHTYQKDRTIRWSLLTIDARLRSAAAQFYDRLLEEAQPIPPCQTSPESPDGGAVNE